MGDHRAGDDAPAYCARHDKRVVNFRRNRAAALGVGLLGAAGIFTTAITPLGLVFDLITSTCLGGGMIAQAWMVTRTFPRLSAAVLRCLPCKAVRRQSAAMLNGGAR